MPCKRYPNFKPEKAVASMSLDEGEQKFLRGFATFDDLPKDRVARAVRSSGMSRYYGARYSSNAPSIKEILEHPEDDMYLSGEVVPCNVKDEGRLAINVICSPIKELDIGSSPDERWLQTIQGVHYWCNGWSDIGWQK